MSLRLVSTLRYLRPVQVAYRVRRAARSIVNRALPGFAARRLQRRIPARPACRQFAPPAWESKPCMTGYGMFSAEGLERGEFRFLNSAKTFSGPIAWKNPEQSYLWDFNLHYFEYIHCVASRPGGADRVRGWMREWIAGNPCPREPGWHPYTTSLRTMNWVRFFLAHPDGGVAHDDLLRSLYAQLLFLESNLEKHLLANHLLENGRALLFGGLFFSGKDADRWRAVGARILADEIDEEYLPQGGHYERSPMYHCILLEGLLETAQLLHAAGSPPAWLPELLRMCDWLWKIRTPDGWYPLFNDAAFGISAPPDHLLETAGRHFGWIPPAPAALSDCDQLCVMRTGSWYCAIDGAEIGPSYNPGHAHSDNFTFELFFDGRPVVVDSGTHHYDRDAARLDERRTAAHNTVVVNGIEQSDVWGSFRVGRRSNPGRVTWREQPAGTLIFEGEYQNAVEPASRIAHQRTVRLDETDGLLVEDTLTGRGMLNAASYLHLAPGWSAEADGPGLRLRLGTLELSLSLSPGLVATIDDYRYAPQFGLSLPARCIKLSRQAPDRLQMACAISRRSGRELSFPRAEHPAAAGATRHASIRQPEPIAR